MGAVGTVDCSQAPRKHVQPIGGSGGDRGFCCGAFCEKVVRQTPEGFPLGVPADAAVRPAAVSKPVLSKEGKTGDGECEDTDVSYTPGGLAGGETVAQEQNGTESRLEVPLLAPEIEYQMENGEQDAAPELDGGAFERAVSHVEVYRTVRSQSEVETLIANHHAPHEREYVVNALKNHDSVYEGSPMAVTNMGKASRFAARAMRGLSCIVLSQGKKAPAKLFTDNCMETVVVKEVHGLKDGGEVPLFEQRLKAIVGVLPLNSNTNVRFPKQVRDLLSPMETDFVVLIEAVSSYDPSLESPASEDDLQLCEVERFFLLLESEKQRDEFITCLGMLSTMSALSPTKPPA